jgi:adenine-specific DNA-methyltransferase
MIIEYIGKKEEAEIINSIESNGFDGDGSLISDPSQNILIEGDNLKALKSLVYDYDLKGKIDLIYIDPPFATNTTFTIDSNSDRVSTISNAKNGVLAYSDKLKGGEFIEFLRERLILLKMLLSDQGSIYLHIDYKIGHYVKIAMDEIFGIQNFRNDITRIKCNPKNFARRGYSNIKDLILFYSKSNDLIWNEPSIGYTDEDIERLYKKVDTDGRRYTTVPVHAPGETKNGSSSQEWMGVFPPKGRHWRCSTDVLDQWQKSGLIEWSSNGVPRKKIYPEDSQGKRVQDIWEFKDPQYPTYPTEKNSNLLDLIIKTSSNEDSIVLDCFCGSGTTLNAAQNNNRKWIGIDQSPEAIKATIKKITKNEKDLFKKSSYTHLIVKEKKQSKAKIELETI